MRSNEVISRSQFFKKAAKELLADEQPHSYGEIVQYIRTQAKGTCLDGNIDSNNVWQSLHNMMQEPESPYHKVKWGTYQKNPPQSMIAKDVADPPDWHSEIYQIMDQAIGLLDRFEQYCSAVQKDIDLAGGHEIFAAIHQQASDCLDDAITGLSSWVAELENLQEKHENGPVQRGEVDDLTLTM